MALCYLPTSGLASNEYPLEILGEGSGMIDAHIAPSIVALTLCLVQHHDRGISNAAG